MAIKLINKKEIYIIVTVLLVCALAILYYANTGQKRIAHIYVDGEVYKSIDLNTSDDMYINIPREDGKFANIKVVDGEISFYDHQCPDGLCEAAGGLSSPLQTAICLPFSVSIVIEGEVGSDEIIAG